MRDPAPLNLKRLVLRLWATIARAVPPAYRVTRTTLALRRTLRVGLPLQDNARPLDPRGPRLIASRLEHHRGPPLPRVPWLFRLALHRASPAEELARAQAYSIPRPARGFIRNPNALEGRPPLPRKEFRNSSLRQPFAARQGCLDQSRPVRVSSWALPSARRACVRWPSYLTRSRRVAVPAREGRRLQARRSSRCCLCPGKALALVVLGRNSVI